MGYQRIEKKFVVIDGDIQLRLFDAFVSLYVLPPTQLARKGLLACSRQFVVIYTIVFAHNFVICFSGNVKCPRHYVSKQRAWSLNRISVLCPTFEIWLPVQLEPLTGWHSQIKSGHCGDVDEHDAEHVVDVELCQGYW